MSNLTVDSINGVDIQDIKKQTADAWVNFKGDGVVSIYDQLKVTSITDNGVGDYIINFTEPQPTSSYAAIGGSDANQTIVTNYSTDSIRLVSQNSLGSQLDANIVSAVVFSS